MEEPTREDYEQAVKVGRVEPLDKKKILDGLYTSALDLGKYNEIAESKRIQEIIEIIMEARRFIKNG